MKKLRINNSWAKKHEMKSEERALKGERGRGRAKRVSKEQKIPRGSHLAGNATEKKKN